MIASFVVEFHAAATSEATTCSYVRRAPEHGVLHRVVREHVQTFLWELDRHDEQRGAPLFVKREFQRFARCGVLAVHTRALQGFHRKRASASGHRDGRTGTVTVIQRFGGALNLNVHFHTLAVDGVFVREPDGSLSFAAAKAPTDEEVEALLGVIQSRILRLLVRRGLLTNESDEGLDEQEAPPLHALYAASVRQRVAMGRRAGATVLRLGDALTARPAPPKGRRQARLGGFDLHANTSVRANSRATLERLCRYLLRAPVAEDRLSLAPDGSLLVRLKTPWRDGTSHIALQPRELLEKLAALIPRPYVNLIVYHGVLAPNAKWRREVVDFGRPLSSTTPGLVDRARLRGSSHRRAASARS